MRRTDLGPVERRYYFYILSTPARKLFLGVTNDLTRRMFELRVGAPSASSSPLAAARLVYLEATSNLGRALARKEQIECWNRHRTWRLIGMANPGWKDLLADRTIRRVSLR